MTTQAVKLQDATDTMTLDQLDQVLLWRIAELDRAGYDSECALELALTPRVDLHDAASLLARGCPVETAVRILL